MNQYLFDHLLQNAVFLIDSILLLGTGGGWNTTLSLPANFSTIFTNYQNERNRTQPTGFSDDFSWFGGLSCSPASHQLGGFGGGGAGCHGGGGGGGFVGGHGGIDDHSNGEGENFQK
jgi:hypothetical protein